MEINRFKKSISIVLLIAMMVTNHGMTTLAVSISHVVRNGDMAETRQTENVSKYYEQYLEEQKLYLLNDVNNPLVKQIFAQEIARHEEKLQYLSSRWEALFDSKEEQAKHYGHALILRQAIHREKQRLQWLREEQARLPQ